MNHVKFTVAGEPKGKSRPRFANSKNGFRTYTPKQTVMYENLVSWTYQQEVGIKLNGQITAKIVAYFPIPKSVSKKKRALMESGVIMYDHKPDTDNVAKIILDSLNGVAYDDDRQICSLTVMKYYSDNPRVEVNLYENNRGD